jgi:hypothetical protein
MKSLLFFCTGITFSTIVISSYGQSIDFSRYPADKTMVVVNRTASVFKEGKITGIRLDEGLGAGILWLKENNFSRGTIEVDLRGRDLLQRSFVGIAFHGSDDATYDAIYFRPCYF